jgi:acyl-CoA thioesterase FadM
MKEVIHTIKVEFGDCDPAGIVWFPNFFRWIDASSRHFFLECGVPRWRRDRGGARPARDSRRLWRRIFCPPKHTVLYGVT